MSNLYFWRKAIRFFQQTDPAPRAATALWLTVHTQRPKITRTLSTEWKLRWKSTSGGDTRKTVETRPQFQGPARPGTRLGQG